MHITLPRNKKRNWILSLIYRLYKLTRAFVPSTKLLPTLLDLEWIFSRLAHEESFRFYNKENHPILKNTVDYIKSKLPKGAVVLDLGCGHGDVSYAIAKAGYEVVGIDHSLSSISDAKNNYHLSNLRFENQDAVTYLEQNKKKFDVLILSHVLEHLDEAEVFLKRFVSYFKYFFIEVPDFDYHYLNVYRIDTQTKLVYSDNDHVTEFDLAELERLVGAAGLRVVDQEHHHGILRLWCERAN